MIRRQHALVALLLLGATSLPGACTLPFAYIDDGGAGAGNDSGTGAMGSDVGGADDGASGAAPGGGGGPADGGATSGGGGAEEGGSGGSGPDSGGDGSGGGSGGSVPDGVYVD